MKTIQSTIRDNLNRIRTRIDAAADRAGRNSQSITLVAVTKYAQPDWVQALFDLGHRDFGESRPQQLARRAGTFPEAVRWHLIGHLQRNKVDLVLPVAAQIHSVDSVRLLQRISASCVRSDRVQPVLLEANISGESTKDGLAAGELREQWPLVSQLPGVQIIGLMTMAPRDAEAAAVRRVFRGLRELREELAQTSHGEHQLSELSMGMSGDFEVAVEEGATLVRVGSSLFEGLASDST